VCRRNITVHGGQVTIHQYQRKICFRILVILDIILYYLYGLFSSRTGYDSLIRYSKIQKWAFHCLYIEILIINNQYFALAVSRKLWWEMDSVEAFIQYLFKINGFITSLSFQNIVVVIWRSLRAINVFRLSHVCIYIFWLPCVF